MQDVLGIHSVDAPAESAGRARMLTLLTICHAINDFYGLLLPVLLPILRTAFGLSYARRGSSHSLALPSRPSSSLSWATRRIVARCVAIFWLPSYYNDRGYALAVAGR